MTTQYPLSVREEGAGPPLLWLHALGASSRYWQGRLGDLPTQHRCIMPDLLGFADSPQPDDNAYTVDDHLAALVGTLADRGDGATPLTLIGHSLGAILAVEFAARNPERVRGLVVMGMPVYGSRAEAEAFIIAHGGRFARSQLHTERPTGRRFRLGLPLYRVIKWGAPYVVRGFPREVVADSFKNTWESYGRTLERCILAHDLAPALAALPDIPILALHGTHDPTASLANVEAVAARMPNVHLQTMEGGHHLFLTQNAAARRAITDYLVDR